MNSDDDRAFRIMLRAQPRRFRQTLLEAERSPSVELGKIAGLSEAIEFWKYCNEPARTGFAGSIATDAASIRGYDV